MNFVIDGILIVIIAICIIVGWKKGFIISFMNMVSFFIALAASYFLYGYVSDLAYQKLFLPKISSMIQSSIVSGAQNTSLADLFNTKPQFFTDILNRYSTFDEVESFFNKESGKGVNEISDFMASPIASVISKVLAFIVLFIVFMIVLKILTAVLDGVFHLPVLNFANKVLGIALGLVMGLLFAWLVSAIMGAVLPKLSQLYPSVISEDLADKTTICKFLYQFNPLKWLTK